MKNKQQQASAEVERTAKALIEAKSAVADVVLLYQDELIELTTATVVSDEDVEAITAILEALKEWRDAGETMLQAHNAYLRASR